MSKQSRAMVKRNKKGGSLLDDILIENCQFIMSNFIISFLLITVYRV